MRVLYAYPFCGLGGVEVSVLNRIDALAAHGIEGHALFREFYGTGGASSLGGDARVTVTSDPARIRVLLRRGFDVVVAVDDPEFLEYLASRPHTGPVVFETHVSEPDAFDRLLRVITHPRVDHVVVPSRFSRGIVLERGVDPAAVTVLTNLVDTERFTANAASGRDANRTNGLPILLWVGRLEDNKNPVEFARVARRLLDGGRDLRLLVVGDSDDDERYAAHCARVLEALSDAHRHRIELRRAVPNTEMPGVYADVARSGGALVSTSLRESAGLIFLEAMACLCPVVAPRVCGVPEFVTHGVTGALYESGDTAAAVAALEALLDPASRAARDEGTRSARGFVVANHSLHAAGHHAATLLRRLSQPRSTSDAEPGSVVPGLVSTIIPVHNRPGMLVEAVESVLAQTYPDIEILIVDDASTDDTPDTCRRLAGLYPAVRVIRTEHRRAGLARETGRVAARGEYIQYLDSDDLLAPEKFDVMLGALRENPEADIAYCWTRRYRVGDEAHFHPAELSCERREQMFPEFVTRRFWCTSTPIYRRRLCDRRGAWLGLSAWEDLEYDFGIAALDPKLVHVAEWLTDIRDHTSQRLTEDILIDTPRFLSEAVHAAVSMADHMARAGLKASDRHVRGFLDDLRVMGVRCEQLGLHEDARTCAGLVTRWLPGLDAADLGRIDLAVDVELSVRTLRMRPSEAVKVSVTVTNRSNISLRSGEVSSELTSVVLEPDGTPALLGNPITDLPLLAPFESAPLGLWLRAPQEPGLYYIEIDVRWAGRIWIGRRANRPQLIKLLVTDLADERHWVLHVQPGNAATLHPGQDPDAVSLQLEEATTGTPWHVQLQRTEGAVSQGQSYELVFDVRASAPGTISAAVSLAQAPWNHVGLYQDIQVGTAWQPFTLGFDATEDATCVRVHFDCGRHIGMVEWRGVSLKVRSNGERVALLAAARTARFSIDHGVAARTASQPGRSVYEYQRRRFLERSRSLASGRVLELSGLTELDDACRSAESPSFDAVICTGVLERASNPHDCAAALRRLLAPGGTLFVAVPHVRSDGDPDDLWRMTPRGLGAVLTPLFGTEAVQVTGYGNSLVSAAELRAVPADAFLHEELETDDPAHPVLVAAHAHMHRPARVARTMSTAQPFGLILMYHRVAHDVCDPWELCVTPEHFDQQLEVLSRNATVLSLPQMIEAVRNRNVPPGAVSITFDDGYVDNFTVAMPALERWELPATFYITSGHIDLQVEFWWDELERILLTPGRLPQTFGVEVAGEYLSFDLGAAADYTVADQQAHRAWRAWGEHPTPRHAAYRDLWWRLRPLAPAAREQSLSLLRERLGGSAGARPWRLLGRRELVADLVRHPLIDVGCHTVTHPQLSAQSDAEQIWQIGESRRQLEEVLGAPVRNFAYPYGEYSLDSPGFVRSLGLASACTTEPGFVTSASDVFQLPRFGVESLPGEAFERQLEAWRRGSR